MVEHQAWEQVPENQDPFFDTEASSETRVCTAQAWEAEGEVLEVDTSTCNYVTLIQPSQVAISAGDTLEINAWWQTLISAQPAEGYFAVFIDDVPVLDERVPIPSAADARDEQRQSPRDFPAGTPIYLHVHNHGTNSWSLGSLIRQ